MTNLFTRDLAMLKQLGQPTIKTDATVQAIQATNDDGEHPLAGVLTVAGGFLMLLALL